MRKKYLSEWKPFLNIFMIVVNGVLYEQIGSLSKIAEYTKLIADTLSTLLHEGTVIPNRISLRRLLSMKQLGTPSDILEIKLSFNGSDWGYSYYYPTMTLTLPHRILVDKKLSKRDYIAISHELEHHFQYIEGRLSDEGAYTNDEQVGSRRAYVNDSNELSAMMGQIENYISSNDEFRNEVAQYDFEPFIEEVVSKILYEKDVKYYLDELLSEDNRNKLLSKLLLIWRSIKH